MPILPALSRDAGSPAESFDPYAPSTQVAPYAAPRRLVRRYWVASSPLLGGRGGDRERRR